jgi:UDP-glucose 4-epimerase
MIRDFAHAYGLRFVLLRYFNASGGSEDGSHGEDHRPETHLIPLVLQTLLGQREKLQVFGSDYSTPDGTCIRDYIHVEDLAEIHELSALWAAKAAEGYGEAFNAGTGTGHSVMEVIATAERVTGKTMAFEVGKRRPGDAATLVASSDKALRELGWTPRFQRFDDLVASAWEWHSRHPQGYAR